MTQPFSEYEKKGWGEMPGASRPRIPFILRCLSVKGNSCDKRGDKRAGANAQPPQPGTVRLGDVSQSIYHRRCPISTGHEGGKGSRRNKAGFSLCPWLLYISDRIQSGEKKKTLSNLALEVWFLFLFYFFNFLYSKSFSLKF